MTQTTTYPLIRPIDPDVFEHLHTFKAFTERGSIHAADFELLRTLDPKVVARLEEHRAWNDNTSHRNDSSFIKTLLIETPWRLDSSVSRAEVILAGYLLSRAIHTLDQIPVADVAYVLARARAEFFGDMVGADPHAQSPLTEFLGGGRNLTVSTSEVMLAQVKGATVNMTRKKAESGKVLPSTIVWSPWDSGLDGEIMNHVGVVYGERFKSLDPSGLFWVWMSKYLFRSWTVVLSETDEEDGKGPSRREQRKKILDHIATIRQVDFYDAAPYLFGGVNEPELVVHGVKNGIDIDILRSMQNGFE